MQIPAVGRKKALLLCHGPNHPRVAVADDGDVVVAVEVAAVLRVEQPDSLPSDQVRRALVEQGRTRQRRPPPQQQVARGNAPVRKTPTRVAEAPRDGVYSDLVDAVEEGASGRLAARAVRGVVWVKANPPGGDRDLGGEPGRHEVGEQFRLLVVKGC